MTLAQHWSDIRWISCVCWVVTSPHALFKKETFVSCMEKSVRWPCDVNGHFFLWEESGLTILTFTWLPLFWFRKSSSFKTSSKASAGHVKIYEATSNWWGAVFVKKCHFLVALTSSTILPSPWNMFWMTSRTRWHQPRSNAGVKGCDRSF